MEQNTVTLTNEEKEKIKEDYLNGFIAYLTNNNWVMLNKANTDPVMFNYKSNINLPYRSLSCYFYDHLKTRGLEYYGTFDSTDHIRVTRALNFVMGTTFLPKADSIVQESGHRFLNIWKPYISKSSGVKPIPLFDEYMERLFPDVEERKQVISFFAHMFQRPEQRPNYGLMFISDTGTGKGVLYSILSELLCKQTKLLSDFDELTNRFSNALYGTSLILLDDCRAHSDKQMTALKSKMTGQSQHYEEKGEMPVMKPCFTRVILASNERRPLKIDASERRWYCPKYLDHRISREETASFITNLLNWCDKEGGYDAIYHYLNTYDISAFDPNVCIQTETLLEMIGASKTTLETKLEEYLTVTPVFKLSEIQAVFNDYDPDLVKIKLVELGCLGIGQEVRLLKNHPNSKVRNNNRYVYSGDRVAAIKFLEDKILNPSVF